MLNISESIYVKLYEICEKHVSRGKNWADQNKK